MSQEKGNTRVPMEEEGRENKKGCRIIAILIRYVVSDENVSLDDLS